MKLCGETAEGCHQFRNWTPKKGKERNWSPVLPLRTWMMQAKVHTLSTRLNRTGPNLTSCRPDSICPGVTAHILSIPCLPTPPHHTYTHSPVTWPGRAEWTCEAQAPLQAKVCKYTTEPRSKGRRLEESSRDANSFKKSERWACP